METLLVTTEFQDMGLPPSNDQCGPFSALFCMMYLIISYYIALAYSSNEKRAEWESFWKLWYSSTSSNKSHWWFDMYLYLDFYLKALLEKWFTALSCSQPPSKVTFCLKFREDWADVAMPFIPLLCSLREHQQKVWIMLNRFWAVQGIEVWVKWKICNKNLFLKKFWMKF